MTDGTRTRDIQGHNLTLCQLSYGHQPRSESNGWQNESNREKLKTVAIRTHPALRAPLLRRGPQEFYSQPNLRSMNHAAWLAARA